MMYTCFLCMYQTKDISNLKKVECTSCPDKSKNYSYLCPKCLFPLFKK